ncbi:hypothetical protein Hanom_Chr16g01423721 [Helianthus anomalus]
MIAFFSKRVKPNCGYGSVITVIIVEEQSFREQRWMLRYREGKVRVFTSNSLKIYIHSIKKQLLY